jgi:hypothetical protein
MSQAVRSELRSSVRTKNGHSQPAGSACSTIARNGGSVRSQRSQDARRATAVDLTRLLDAGTVDLRGVGDAIRVHPELESLVLKLCELLVLSPGVAVASAEEAAIVLGTDRLRTVVHAWSVNEWTGDVFDGPQSETPTEISNVEARSHAGSPATARIAAGRRTLFLSSEFSAEILDLASLFHWAQRDAVSFVNSAGENYADRLDLELKRAARLTDLLVRDLLSVVSLASVEDLSPEQEALLQEILQARS